MIWMQWDNEMSDQTHLRDPRWDDEQTALTDHDVVDETDRGADDEDEIKDDTE